MSKVESVATVEGAVQGVERLIRWLPVAITSAVSGVATGISAYLTDALAAYKPVSWVAASIGGVLVALLVWYIWIWIQRGRLQLAFVRDMAARPPPFNPLDSVFTRQTIDLHAFRTPSNLPAEHKTFVDCDLRGPETVILGGRSGTISGAAFIDCELIKVKDRFVYDRLAAPNSNCLILLDVTITRGRIMGVTLLIPESLAPVFEAGVGGVGAAQWATL